MSSEFRNIELTPEIIAMGCSDIQVQAQNMVLRHQDGLLLISKYDPNNLDKTARLLESKLAEYVGKPNGLPEGFDCKAFAALVSIALLNDLRAQNAEAQEAQEEHRRWTEQILDEINELKEDNANISFGKWQQTLIEKYNNLKNVVDKKLPNIWSGLEFGLASLRILNIDDCTLPFIGILLGRPGSGKTVPIMLLSKWIYRHYTDDFSTKAWVTHTTSVKSQEELALIDMLLKVKDHQFLTPELATLFSLNEDDLRLALSRITRIADGHGFFSDSGVHGHRGYDDVMFTWLGAVVDISNHVYKVMSNLGPRLYFLRLPYVQVTAKDLFKYLTDKENFNSKYKAIEEALLDYLKWFEIGPKVLPGTPNSPHLRKVQWNSDKNDENAMRCISELSFLLGYLRREGRAYAPDKIVLVDANDGNEDKELKYSYFTGEVEDIKRAGQVLTNLARGKALHTGRNYITMDDIKIVAKTVLSTARVERVRAFIALLDTQENWISKKDLATQLNISPSTAFRLMIELKAIELVDIEETNNVEYTENNNPAKVKIMRLKMDKFRWFLSDEFKKLRGGFTPVDNRKHMRESDPEIEAAKSAAKSSSSMAAVEAPNSTPKNKGDDISEDNKKKLKAYDIAQKKIRSEAAKMKRSSSTGINTAISTGIGTDSNSSPKRNRRRRINSRRRREKSLVRGETL